MKEAEMRDFLRKAPLHLLREEWARRNSLRRKTHGGGRPKVLSPCPGCGGEFGAREMRLHRAACKGAKAAKKRTARSDPRPAARKQ